jgi:hypothetical protein
MRPQLIAFLPLGLLLQACGGEPVVISERQRAVCRLEAEQGATTKEAAHRNAACLKKAIETEKGLSETPSSAALISKPQAAQAPQPGPQATPAPVNRYAYCVLHREDVIATASDLTSASKLWMVAPSRYAHDSYGYREAKRNYELALAKLDRLLPPEVRQGMDLIPQAVQAFSRCDKDELS